MPQRHLWRFLTCAILASGFAAGHDRITLDLPPLNRPNPITMLPVEPSSWLDTFWRNSIVRFFAPTPALTWLEASIEVPDVPMTEPTEPPEPVSVSPDCPVEPLPLIDDAEAASFEEQAGTSAVVVVDGLTPTTVVALENFQRIIGLAGGAVAITSAYRPSAYQDHLQAVWDKWMIELRRNRSEDCEALKEQVAEEFSRHQLLTTQRPVPISDHTLGIGFDASVSLPRRSRLKRRRISVDRLAREAGVSRPARRQDPVHFRLIGGRV